MTHPQHPQPGVPWPPVPPGTRPEPPHQGGLRWPARIAAIIGLLVLAVVVGNAAKDSETRPGPRAQTTPAASASANTPVVDGFGDGIWRVGADVPPATYRSPGAQTGLVEFCSWRRLSDLSGESSAVIALGSGNAGEPQVVTIAASDRGFEVHGCEPFVQVS